MCQWFPLRKDQYPDVEICFACPAIRCRAGASLSETIEMIYLDRWYVKYVGSYDSLSEGERYLVKYADANEKQISSLYQSWLGQLIVEETE